MSLAPLWTLDIQTELAYAELGGLQAFCTDCTLYQYVVSWHPWGLYSEISFGEKERYWHFLGQWEVIWYRSAVLKIHDICMPRSHEPLEASGSGSWLEGSREGQGPIQPMPCNCEFCRVKADGFTNSWFISSAAIRFRDLEYIHFMRGPPSQSIHAQSFRLLPWADDGLSVCWMHV